tara:strand:+ start:4149 stop:4325 length:177 start_codon:yes stop_codon:yes gene_type:complete
MCGAQNTAHGTQDDGTQIATEYRDLPCAWGNANISKGVMPDLMQHLVGGMNYLGGNGF